MRTMLKQQVQRAIIGFRVNVDIHLTTAITFMFVIVFATYGPQMGTRNTHTSLCVLSIGVNEEGTQLPHMTV